jgi:hypothetical protein
MSVKIPESSLEIYSRKGYDHKKYYCYQRYLVCPKIEYDIECNDLKGYQCRFKHEKVDSSTKAKSWIHEVVCISNLKGKLVREPHKR